ncbi:MAG: 3-phosphoshikimate 1-carboxyvinyltransferase [Flavobacterium sp.]|nr:3-phosphoshikimate 1-carboxyvinyltransferase [Pedobacter sp.]
MDNCENICVSILNNNFHCTVFLTGSKSESNRALIMEALSEGKVEVKNLSEAADTVTLSKILNKEYQISKHQTLNSQFKTKNSKPKTATSQLSTKISEINVGPAGTAMRFLTAFFTLQTGEVILTGSKRMQERPIGILVDALIKLGADIQFAALNGFPPLKIKGPLLQKTSRIAVNGNISSQYISSLLLIAPKLPLGLELEIESKLTSTPYVEMTLSMLEKAGIRYDWTDKIIKIKKQEYRNSEIIVEPDWSAASYWYAIAALSDEAEFFLPGLNAYSLQGDSRITEIMANFGISSQFKDGGVYLKKEPKKLERLIFDFKDCPDLAQTVIVCCAALGHNATFTGLETLKIKETDRINALQTELKKIGVKLHEKNLVCKLDCTGLNFPDKVFIATYDDHRMAMAFTPLALKIAQLEIENYHVVNKSYPGFWNDLKTAGFMVN